MIWKRAAMAVFAVSMVVGVAVSQSADENDPPVEKSKKNIKVLRGLPTSQLIPVMTVMSNSLGVTCSHCHTEAWDSDEKPEKEQARKMITMVRSINAQNFGGRTAVTCNSCHRGSTEPVDEPSVEAAGWNKPRMAESVPRQMLSIDELLGRYAKALDPEGKWGSVQKRVGSGIVSRSNGRRDPASDTFELTMSKPSSVEMKTALSYPPDAERLLPLTAPQSLSESFTSLEVDHVESINGRESYVVLAISKSGGLPRWLAFDAGTGLLMRVTRSTPTIVGPLPERFDFSDYRQVDGMMVPFLLQWSRGDYQVTHRFARITQEGK